MTTDEQAAAVAALFSAPCRKCGHTEGDHAAWRSDGHWPCLVAGCTCEGTEHERDEVTP